LSVPSSADPRPTLAPVASTNYVYELRRADTVVATGRLTRDAPLEVGEELTINDRPGLVRSIVPTLDPHEQRVVIQLRRDSP
jgi:hypothetical protein